MTPSLDFDVDVFLSLSPSERAQLCGQSAARASKLAERAEANHRIGYQEIARQWLILAQEMDDSHR